MKILFIGCVKSSQLFLEKLVNLKYDIVGVLTKSQSSYNSDFVDLGIYCRENNIDYKYVQNINDNEYLDYIKSKDPDIIYCFGWSQLLSNDILSICKKGAIGFHPADLPNNKGRHPIIWALVLGLSHTASTFFFMDSNADSGDIVSKEKIPISYEDDAYSLYSKIIDVALNQIEKFTQQIQDNNFTTTKNSSTGNTWRKRSMIDGQVDWRMSSLNIYNLVRGLSKPYVFAHFIHDDKYFKIFKCEEVFSDKYFNIEPGKIIFVYSPNSFLVKVGDNLIKIVDCETVNLKAGDYL